MAKLTPKASKFVGHKIRLLAKEGYKFPKQRVAIALNLARSEGFKIPKRR